MKNIIPCILFYYKREIFWLTHYWHWALYNINWLTLILGFQHGTVWYWNVSFVVLPERNGSQIHGNSLSFIRHFTCVVKYLASIKRFNVWQNENKQNILEWRLFEVVGYCLSDIATKLSVQHLRSFKRGWGIWAENVNN